MGSFNKKIVIVTGAASGIGKATAECFIEKGATVFGFDRNEQGLIKIDGLIACPVDMMNHTTLKEYISEIINSNRSIDILINNAGFSYYSRHTESTIEEWRRTFAVNLEAYFVMAKLVVPSMIRKGTGRIVNVSSTQAIASEPSVGAYAASKGGISAWTRTLAVDLAEFGILVNSVSPGCIRTAMSVIDGEDEVESETFRDWYVRRRKIPMARAGEPKEVAKAILFLSGGDCTYITGHNLVVDGGLTITF